MLLLLTLALVRRCWGPVLAARGWRLAAVDAAAAAAARRAATVDGGDVTLAAGDDAAFLSGGEAVATLGEAVLGDDVLVEAALLAVAGFAAVAAWKVSRVFSTL